MAATLTQIFRILKDILDEIGSSRTVTHRGRPTTIDLNPVVAALNQLLTELQAQTTTLSSINLNVDGLEAIIASTNTLLTSIDGNTDGLEALLTTSIALLGDLKTSLIAIDGNTDGLEGLATIGNASLAAIDANTDGLETLATTGNASLVAIDGNTDGLEGLSTAANALLTAMAATLVLMNSHLNDIEDALYSVLLFERLELVEDALKQPITGLDWGGLILTENGLILTQVSGIESNTDSLEADNDKIIEIADDRYRTYHYAGTWTALAVANMRLQYVFVHKTIVRFLRMKRTAGSATPSLTVSLYNPHQARDVNTFHTGGGGTDHNVRFGSTSTSDDSGTFLVPAGFTLRIDFGLVLNFTPDVYAVDLLCEVAGSTLPTRSQFGTAFTEVVDREVIDR